MLDANGAQLQKRLKSMVLHLNLPYTVYSSPFPMEQISMHRGAPPERRVFPSTVKQDYLIDPVNMPIAASPVLLRLLQRVDGQRNLKAIFSKIHQAGPQQVISFLTHLVSRDMIEIPGI
jgi:hypothetical protein